MRESYKNRRFEKQLRRAEARRQAFGKMEALSAEQGQGELVIYTSEISDPQNRRQLSEKQVDYYEEEAQKIRQDRLSENERVTIRRGIGRQAIAKDLRDPNVTGLVFIGPGSMGELHGSDGKIDCLWVAQAADHLKQGRIEQRMFGNYAEPDRLIMPVGAFAVKNIVDLSIVTHLQPDPNSLERTGVFPPFETDRALLDQARERDAQVLIRYR